VSGNGGAGWPARAQPAATRTPRWAGRRMGSWATGSSRPVIVYTMSVHAVHNIHTVLYTLYSAASLVGAPDDLLTTTAAVSRKSE
jgi:hypothetical protein